MWTSFLYALISLGIIYATHRMMVGWRQRKPSHLKHYKDVPMVEGNWPIAGHGIAFGKDIIGFLENCRMKYGNIFRIKIFKINMVVCCDRKMVPEFFKATEDHMSLYDVLDRLYFSDGFSDRPESLPVIIALVRKTIAVRYDEFMPKIESQARMMIERLKTKCQGQKVCLEDEMIRFVANTSAQCFIGMTLSDDFYADLVEFTRRLNQIVPLTYFFPKWLLKMVLNPGLRKYRMKIVNHLRPEIQKYREDGSKTDSLVIRKCVDYVDPDTNHELTDQEIGDVIVCLLYVSSENTALGLTAALTDLASHPQYWDQVRQITGPYLQANDTRSLMSSPLVDACVMESARLNSHVFAMNRRPRSRDATFGEYYVGNVDTVALCQPQLMKLEHASDIYANPSQYNPNRFLPPFLESKKTDDLSTWGSKIHLCPGKMFAIYEIKMAMALITRHFEINLPDGPLPPLNYFSPSAFSNRALTVTLEEVSLEDNLMDESIVPSVDIKGCRVELYPGGWCLRQYLSLEQQKQLYELTLDLSKNAKERDEIKPNAKTAYPITYHNLVYTGSSNCATPTTWYNWGDKTWEWLQDHRELLNFPVQAFKSNSLYAQVFTSLATMKVHKDEHVTYGISVSLGSSCDFRFGDQVLKLHSGDVFVADFSQVDHGIERIHENTEPGWWNEVTTFGQARCSVQLRDLSGVEGKHMTNEEFKRMLVDRAN